MSINVLSLFDGMSCGQIALNRAGIDYDKYFASEIDKWAIKVTQKNYPDTIQLGDVIGLYNWNLPQINLLLGGSPCQGFSVAGNGLNFDDPRSKLFFWYVNALRYLKPKWFLFENVRMKSNIRDAISYELGVEPVEIDSALVSAQSRKRLYWTNIPNITQPEDREILLKDIIEDGYVDRDKSYCIDANYYKGGSVNRYFEKSSRQQVLRQSEKRLMVNKIGYINRDHRGSRVHSLDGKSVILCSSGGGWGMKTGLYNTKHDIIRKLTPLECERLQTVPEGYTDCVSDSQRYKMLGNGWTIDVIVHILRNIQ